MKTLERNPFEAAKAKFGRFLDVAEIENLPPQERMRYEARLKSYRDYVNTVSFAEEKGVQKGLRKGEILGMMKGETQKAYEIARTMKQDGFPVDTIVKYTGLQADEIIRL